LFFGRLLRLSEKMQLFEQIPVFCAYNSFLLNKQGNWEQIL